MSDTLHVEIPITFEVGQDVESVVAMTIKENQEDFYPLFERLIDMGDARMTVVDDSLEIEHVSADETGGVAEVTFLSDFYAGCKDMNSVDDHQASLAFQIEKGLMTFDLELPQRWVPDI